MKSKMTWSRILKIVGGLAIAFGTLDPLEGSVLILPGSGLIALGMKLGGRGHKTVVYWTWTFLLITIGVIALFGLSAAGGIGGKHGLSAWWGLLLLPYPVGWLMALGAGVVGLARVLKNRSHSAHA